MQTHTPFSYRLITTFGSAIVLSVCLMLLLTMNLITRTMMPVQATISEQVVTPQL